MAHNLRTVLVLAAALGAAGCDENLSTIAGPTPNLEPTFASIQRDIFEASDSSGRSLCIACHNNANSQFAARLNLTRDLAYDQLVNAASVQRPNLLRVAPGNPDGSYLVHKLEPGRSIVGLRMPRNGPPYLTDGQISIIRRWIAIGAPRN